MGWLEIDNVSKMFKRRARAAQDDLDDDDIDENVEETRRDDGDEEPADQLEEKDREVWALRDISLRVNAGDSVMVVGLSGSGKTTLMRLLAGLTLPTSGEVRGKGLVVPLNFIRTPIAGNRTGRQNLVMLESLMGLSRGRILDRANEIATFAGMERQLDQRVAQYSSSMYAKLAIAAGLLCEPGILLVDESISGGDPPFRARVRSKLGDLVNQGTTLVYASQSSGNVGAELCQRAVWLDKGRIIADGRCDKIISLYENSAFEEFDGITELWDDPGVADVVEGQPPREQDVSVGHKLPRFVQEEWASRVKLMERRWQSFADRRRESVSSKHEARSGPVKGGLRSLGKVINIRLFNSDEKPVGVTVPGEPIRVELEVEAIEADIEIGVRVELETRGVLVFASELPLPFSAAQAGRYILSFPLEAWLTAQERESAVLYKIRARTFFRRPSLPWGDMAIASARLIVRGSLREAFLGGNPDHVKDPVLLDPLPVWLEGVIAMPVPDVLNRKPLLRPALEWQIHRVEGELANTAETPPIESEETQDSIA